MSSNPPSEGMFFVDQPAQPPASPPPQVTPPPAPEPAAQHVAAPEPSPAPEAAQSETMRDVPLGTLIFRAGLLAEEQLEDALQEGMRSGKRLGEVLLERGWLHERDLGRLLAGQKGLPFVELSGVSPDPTAVPLIPEEKARMQNALAIAFEKGVPVVAVADPTNDLVMENLRRVLGCEPRLVVAAHGDLHRKIEEAYEPVSDVPVSPEPVAAPEPAAVAPPPPSEPVPAPAPAPAPEPVAVSPAPEPEAVAPPPEPAPLASPEPAAATPQPAPLSTPPVVEPVQPVEQPVEVPAQVQPIQAQPLAQPAPEEQPAAPAPAGPVVEAPPAAENPPPLIQPLSVAPPLAPEAAPPPPPEPAAAPEVTAPAVEQPPAQAGPERAAPVEPQPAPEVSVNGSATDEAHHFVVLRLNEGEQLEIGTFASTEEAQGFAQEVVRQIAAAEGEATWPFFAGRFLRPETIVSVDVIAEATERWMGSSARARWASANPRA
jgi:hypothetical protein